MYRSLGRNAIRQWSAGAVDACTRGGRSRLAVRASPVEMYRVSQASPDITKRGQEPTERQNLAPSGRTLLISDVSDASPTASSHSQYGQR